MRHALVVAFGLLACGGGHSGSTVECEHLYSADSQCCTAQSDCTPESGLETCAPPGTPFGCGVCNMDPSDCGNDADCKSRDPASICEPVTCSCDAVPAMRCTAGCTMHADCAEGQSCDITTNRCIAKACATAAQCPIDFICTPTGCSRATCHTRSECSGYCVDGACYTTAGECRGPAA